MLLTELFDTGSGSVMKGLRRAVLDFLTPKAAHNLDSVTVASLIEYLRALDPGIVIDRALIMTLCDPNLMPMVKKIEGELLYLTAPLGDGEERAVDVDGAMADEERISDMASSHAKDAVKK